jgi:hypothetical protein
MKAEAAIIDSSVDACMARVRASYSAYREADVQVGKADKRAEDAQRIAANTREAREKHRLDSARALVETHRAMGIRQGDPSGRWAKFLADEGIPAETARRWMKELGDHDATTSPNPPDWGKSDVPHAVEGGDPATQPDPPRKPFGRVLDMQLLLGRWEDMLTPADIGRVDSLITDPPYSPRTHASKPTRNDGSDADGLSPNYEPWTPAHVKDFIGHWHPRVRGWIACMCDHELIPAYEHAYQLVGRVAFAPVPCVIRGMSVRTRGDGPSSESVYLMVGRPAGAEFAKWGTVQGYHFGNKELGAKHGRGKPRWLMDGIVKFYTRDNDLVCDPLAGYGVTLISALLQGRRAIGAEQDEKAVEEAFRRANASQEPKQVEQSE